MIMRKLITNRSLSLIWLFLAITAVMTITLSISRTNVTSELSHVSLQQKTNPILFAANMGDNAAMSVTLSDSKSLISDSKLVQVA